MLPSASDQAKLFTKNLLENCNLDDPRISLPVFSFRTSLKLDSSKSYELSYIHEWSLRISYKDQKNSYQDLLETHHELTIHQRNLPVLMKLSL